MMSSLASIDMSAFDSDGYNSPCGILKFYKTTYQSDMLVSHTVGHVCCLVVSEAATLPLFKSMAFIINNVPSQLDDQLMRNENHPFISFNQVQEKRKVINEYIVIPTQFKIEFFLVVLLFLMYVLYSMICLNKTSMIRLLLLFNNGGICICIPVTTR